MKYYIGKTEQTKERFEEVLFFATSIDLRKNILEYLKLYKSYDSKRYLHDGLWLYLENKHYDSVYKSIKFGSEFELDNILFKIIL